MVYVEPSWMTLLINGVLLYLLSAVIMAIVAFIITKIISVFHNYSSHESRFLTGVGIFIVLYILSILLFNPIIWNETMEKPSVREEIVTIMDIQPLSGAVEYNSDGYYIENSNQLMFVTSDNKEFKNTENWLFDKFETRTIFNSLRINGTYKIIVYGWRNGFSDDFPNILSVDEVIDENNTQPNVFDNYFGATSAKRNQRLDLKDSLWIFGE